jgi:hypothetical protein
MKRHRIAIRVGDEVVKIPLPRPAYLPHINLSNVERQVWDLKYGLGWTVDRIAGRSGLSVKEVRYWLRSAHRQMRKSPEYAAAARLIG